MRVPEKQAYFLRIRASLVLLRGASCDNLVENRRGPENLTPSCVRKHVKQQAE